MHLWQLSKTGPSPACHLLEFGRRAVSPKTRLGRSSRAAAVEAISDRCGRWAPSPKCLHDGGRIARTEVDGSERNGTT